MAFFFPGIRVFLIGERATLIIIPKEFYVSTIVRAYNMELGKGLASCIYGVHLTLKAQQKMERTRVASEIYGCKHANALPTYICSCALGASVTFRALYITYKF